MSTVVFLVWISAFLLCLVMTAALYLISGALAALLKETILFDFGGRYKRTQISKGKGLIGEFRLQLDRNNVFRFEPLLINENRRCPPRGR